MRTYYVQTNGWAAIAVIVLSGTAVAEEVREVSAEVVAAADPAAPDLTAVDEVDQRDTSATCEPLFRHTSYPAAWTAAQKNNRPILVYVSMTNCPHCEKMMEQTYELPAIGRLVTGSFETIRVDRNTHAKLVSSLRVKWYPTTVLVGPNNKILDVIEGFVDPKRFQRRLQTGLASSRSVTQTR